MYTALITHQYVVQMGWEKLHLHESQERKEEQQTTYKKPSERTFSTGSADKEMLKQYILA